MGERLPRPMTAEEIEAFFTRIDDLRDRTLFSLLYGSGVRIAEALVLNVEDLNLADGTFRVVGKGDRERIGYLSEGTIKLIRRHLRGRGRPRRRGLFLSLARGGSATPWPIGSSRSMARGSVAKKR